MLARVAYASFSLVLIVLAGVFAAWMFRGRHLELPIVQAPADIAGRSCETGLETARELTNSAALEGSNAARRRTRWIVPAVVIGLTFLNYVVNNVQSTRRDSFLMEEFNRLAGIALSSGESR